MSENLKWHADLTRANLRASVVVRMRMETDRHRREMHALQDELQAIDSPVIDDKAFVPAYLRVVL